MGGVGGRVGEGGLVAGGQAVLAAASLIRDR